MNYSKKEERLGKFCSPFEGSLIRIYALLRIHILLPNGYPKDHPKEQEAYLKKHNLAAHMGDKLPNCKALHRQKKTNIVALPTQM